MTLSVPSLKEIYREAGLVLGPGETANVNHGVSCPAGMDTRGRLYFTRSSRTPHVVMYYCHNCGEGGAFVHRHGMAGRGRGHKVSEDNTDEYIKNMWEGGVNVEETPFHIRTWLKRGDSHNLRPSLLRYHPGEDALLIPVRPDVGPPFTSEEPPPAMQIRRFSRTMPKYTTVVGTGAITPLRTHIHIHDQPTKTVVLCEDYLSGIRLHRCSWMRGEPERFAEYVLYGAHATMEDLVRLRNEYGYDRIAVWLDNDRPNIIDTANKISRQARLLGIPSAVVTEPRDPKLVPRNEMAGIMQGLKYT